MKTKAPFGAIVLSPLELMNTFGKKAASFLWGHLGSIPKGERAKHAALYSIQALAVAGGLEKQSGKQRKWLLRCAEFCGRCTWEDALNPEAVKIFRTILREECYTDLANTEKIEILEMLTFKAAHTNVKDSVFQLALAEKLRLKEKMKPVIA